MANTGTLILRITEVEGERVQKKLNFRFRRMIGARTIPRSKWSAKKTHRPPEYAFEVPAIPAGFALAAEINSKWYRRRYSKQFSVQSRQTLKVDAAPVFRDPRHWGADFTRWSRLSDRFDDLKAVLNSSGGLRVRGWKKIGPFVGAKFDNPADKRIIVAKAALLNLFTTLHDTKEPTMKRKTWFAFIEEILEIGRERLIARVDPDLAKRVFQIHSNHGQFKEYRRAPVGDHAKNMPRGYVVREIKSVKSNEKKANLQLTVARTRHRETGEEAAFLDADIDESGELVPHFIDAFLIHPFSGGTHPYDIHELLVARQPALNLGYKLVPKG